MQVNPVNNTSSSSTSSTSQANANALSNYNSFLQLLVTELQNQDPTKPMDPTQSITQLATFSQVQQSVQSNQYLSSLLDASQLNQAAAYVGKTLTSSDGATSGVVQSVSLTSTGPVATLADGSTLAIATGVTIS
jgi:flagellar basal-body rod modification protein FlgD